MHLWLMVLFSPNRTGAATVEKQQPPILCEFLSVEVDSETLRKPLHTKSSRRDRSSGLSSPLQLLNCCEFSSVTGVVQTSADASQQEVRR